jgi:hypothetical protein
MKNLKLILVFSILLISTACALSNGISGPTVEPPVPASGTVLFQDDFSNPLSGWDRGSTSDGVMDYDGGVFRILVNTPKALFWSAPGTQYTDSRTEVDTAKINGPDSNRAGLICRWDGKQFYLFMISADGYFAVGRAQIVNGAMAEVTLLGQDQMVFSSNINTGMAINHLRADCIGNTLTFYINGFPVSQVTDAAIPSGESGLMGGAFEEGGVDIIFDQFIVMQP